MPQLTIKLRLLVEYPRPVVAITRQYSGGEKKRKKGRVSLVKILHSPSRNIPSPLNSRLVNRVYGWKPAGNFPIGSNERAKDDKIGTLSITFNLLNIILNRLTFNNVTSNTVFQRSIPDIQV